MTSVFNVPVHLIGGEVLLMWMCHLQSETGCRKSGEESGAAVKGWEGIEWRERDILGGTERRGGGAIGRANWKCKASRSIRSLNSMVFIGTAWKNCQLVPKFLDFALLWSKDNFCYTWYFKNEGWGSSHRLFPLDMNSSHPKIINLSGNLLLHKGNSSAGDSWAVSYSTLKDFMLDPFKRSLHLIDSWAVHLQHRGSSPSSSSAVFCRTPTFPTAAHHTKAIPSWIPLSWEWAAATSTAQTEGHKPPSFPQAVAQLCCSCGSSLLPTGGSLIPFASFSLSVLLWEMGCKTFGDHKWSMQLPALRAGWVAEPMPCALTVNMSCQSWGACGLLPEDKQPHCLHQPPGDPTASFGIYLLRSFIGESLEREALTDT